MVCLSALSLVVQDSEISTFLADTKNLNGRLTKTIGNRVVIIITQAYTRVNKIPHNTIIKRELRTIKIMT
jgi:hypothetical protein